MLSVVLESKNLPEALPGQFILCLVLVQPRKTGKRPDMTDKLLTGTLNIKTNKGIIIKSPAIPIIAKTSKRLLISAPQTVSK